MLVAAIAINALYAASRSITPWAVLIGSLASNPNWALNKTRYVPAGGDRVNPGMASSVVDVVLTSPPSVTEKIEESGLPSVTNQTGDAGVPVFTWTLLVSRL